MKTQLACLLALTATAGVARAQLTPAQQALPITSQDQLITGTDGKRYYVTAYNGEQRPMLPAQTPSTATVTIVPNTSRPARVMLDELGLESPVKDQAGRTTCTIFSTIGTVESEYLANYGALHDLSEEYVVSMMNETRPIDWAGGSIGEKMGIAMLYGVPPEHDWPYVPDGWTLVNEALQVVPWAPSGNFDTYIWNHPFYLDLVNYNPLIYPPIKASQDAYFGPASFQWVDNGNADILETLIAQHHSVSIGVDWSWWQQDSNGIFRVNPNGGTNDGHAIVVVGYDRSRHVFRIKNSWSSTWNGNGYAEASYELITKSTWETLYVDAMTPTSYKAPGTGSWRGFWAGSLDGVPGVAVIYHAIPDNNFTTAMPNAVVFHGSDGSVTNIQSFLGGDGTSAFFGYPGGGWEFQLTEWVPGVAAFYGDYDGNQSIWYQCQQGADQNTTPQGYLQAAHDPNVLPPCPNLGTPPTPPPPPVPPRQINPCPGPACI